jgi:hypothetical protein
MIPQGKQSKLSCNLVTIQGIRYPLVTGAWVLLLTVCDNREDRDGWGMYHVWGKGEVCTEFWWGSLRKRDRWGDRGVDGRIMLG